MKRKTYAESSVYFKFLPPKIFSKMYAYYYDVTRKIYITISVLLSGKDIVIKAISSKVIPEH